MSSGDLLISITDPIKNDQGVVNSYISYKINTETTIAAFDDRQFSVIRRYSDFVWLRETLRHQLAGVIVPPLPEKAVMNRFSPEFIEARRRSLERFMTRCADHPTIRDVETFRMFLAADEDRLNKAKAEAKRALASSGTSSGASASSSSWSFSAITGTTTSPLEKAKSADDLKCEETLNYVVNLEAQMTNVAKHTAALMKRGKELSDGLFDFGLALTMLGQHETESLRPALSKMGHTSDELSLLAADQVEKEQRWFEEPVADYIALLGAVREACDRRQQLRRAYFSAVGDREAKQGLVARLEAQAGNPSAETKLPGARGAVSAAERVEGEAAQELDRVTARLLGEVARFKREKADDMRKVVLDYVTLQIEYNRQMEQRWADLVPEIEAIKVQDPPTSNAADSADGLGLLVPPAPAPAANPNAPPQAPGLGAASGATSHPVPQAGAAEVSDDDDAAV